MNKVGRVLLLSIAFATLAAGCRIAPIYNVTEAPVVSNKPVSTADVEKAILRAGATLGWQMTVVKPGTVQGTLNLRTHQAVVDIPYTTKSYSILYKDSVNLDYNGREIHSNYNGWIQNLDKAIKAQLQNL
jgi:hypothetical protein